MPTNNELLKKFIETRFDPKKLNEARRLITTAAGITPEEETQIPKGSMGDYILKKTKNATVHKMILVERALYALENLMRRDGDKDPSEWQASECIKKLDNIMPLLTKEQKIYIKYWQSYYYRYAEPGNDKARYDLLMEVLKTIPPKDPNYTDKCYNSILIMKDFSLPVGDLYRGIKLARKKMPPDCYELHNTQDILDNFAQFYYDSLIKVASTETESYGVRSQSYRQALEVVDDLPINERKTAAQKQERRNAHKLYIYGKLLPLMQQHGDKKDLQKLSSREWLLIRQQSKLQKKLGIGRNHGFDRFR